jgi:hypothetical protein
MKTYDGNLIQRTWSPDVLVKDGGNPPTLGETVDIGGQLFQVTASANELQNDSETGGRFIATRKP